MTAPKTVRSFVFSLRASQRDLLANVSLTFLYFMQLIAI